MDENVVNLKDDPQQWMEAARGGSHDRPGAVEFLHRICAGMRNRRGRGRDRERSKERFCLMDSCGVRGREGCGREDREESQAGAAGSPGIRSQVAAGSGRSGQTQMPEISPEKMCSD